MALIHIPIDEIKAVHLDALIAGAAKESRYIDYKQETYGNEPKALAEFRADISSFANTDGGDIVVGMKAAGDIPKAICPLACDVAAERLRLEQMARTGLQPQLPAVDVQPVSVPGGEVLVVRIGWSYLQPHRVVFRDGKRFWARGSAGKFEPDVEGLRAMFLRGPQFGDRMRAFRDARLALLAAGRGPLPLMDQGLFVLHIVPFSSLDGGVALSIKDVASNPGLFPPIDVRAGFDSDRTLMVWSQCQARGQKGERIVLTSKFFEAVQWKRSIRQFTARQGSFSLRRFNGRSC